VIGWVVGITAVALCVGAVAGYWDQFDPSRHPIRPGLLALAVGCSLVGLCYHAAGWIVLMRGMAPALGLASAARAWAYSQIVKYVPGKVLVFVTRTEICARDGVPPLTVLAGTGLEIVLSLICALVLSLGTMTAWLEGQGLSQWGYILPLAALLVTAHPKVIMAMMRLYYRLRKADVDQVPNLGWGDIIRPLIVYFAGWLLYGVGGYLLVCVVTGGGFESVRDAVGIIGAFPFAWAAGYMVLLAPGGAGFREGALAIALSPWMPLKTAMVVAILARLCHSGLDLLIGGGWWLGHRIVSKSSR